MTLDFRPFLAKESIDDLCEIDLDERITLLVPLAVSVGNAAYLNFKNKDCWQTDSVFGPSYNFAVALDHVLRDDPNFMPLKDYYDATGCREVDRQLAIFNAFTLKIPYVPKGLVQLVDSRYAIRRQEMHEMYARYFNDEKVEDAFNKQTANLIIFGIRAVHAFVNEIPLKDVLHYKPYLGSCFFRASSLVKSKIAASVYSHYNSISVAFIKEAYDHMLSDSKIIKG